MQKDFYQSYRRSRESKEPSILDRVLCQRKAICWAIGIVRQLSAMLRLKGLLDPCGELSIQCLVNGVAKYYLEIDGTIKALEFARRFLVEKGIVFESQCPLTYALDEENKDLKDDVFVAKVDDLIIHHASDYKSYFDFGTKLYDLYSNFPVAASVPLFTSFKNFDGNGIYQPTTNEKKGNHPRENHLMLITGHGSLDGVFYWELQESVGEQKGDEGYIKVNMLSGAITHFVEIINPKVCSRSREVVMNFTETVSVDKFLFRHDILVNKVHASMLAQKKYLSPSDENNIQYGLNEIERLIELGKFDWKIQRKDLHGNIEGFLIDQIGDAAKTLYAGRSKNDQISTDLRLWCRDSIDAILLNIKRFQKVLVRVAQKNVTVIVPGYAHLQGVQPVVLSHVLLTYVEQLQRDASRYINCRERLNFCPLGACDLGGTGLDIDRSMTSTALGFTRPMSNSIDAVSDRDFVLEFLYANANTAIHLSRLGEEWVLWSSEEFGFMTPTMNVSTSSSVMPQKQNPDTMELVRGKSARVIGSLVTVLTMCKGLPLAYNQDYQEDKEPMIDSFNTIMGMIDVSVEFAKNVTFNEERINQSLPSRHLDATTLVEYLVSKGMAFRSSQDVVRNLVATCVSRVCKLEDLSLEEMKQESPKFEEDVFEYLGFQKSVKSFTSPGSTGQFSVSEQLVQWCQELKI